MNVSAIMREMIAKSRNNEQFLLHVAELIETQLKEWDNRYEVFVMLLKNYEIAVKLGEQYYHTSISNEEIGALKKEGPFALDRKLWTALQKEGLPIKESQGNYLQLVFEDEN